ncbi:hypothetical protein EE612_028688, partial [Oryza sativa]
AVELGDLGQKIQITTELNNDIMKCIHDQNANHVVQKNALSMCHHNSYSSF